MKTKIMHYGNDSEIFDSGMGTYDEHDSETGQGVYGREDMMRFVHVVTDHFLTPRQKYFYFQCVVYGKKVEDIAALEGLDDSTVYKHLKLARKRIANVNQLMRIAGGKKGAIVLFQQAVQTMTSDRQTVVIEKYVNGLSINAIIQKTGLTYGRVRNILSSTRNRLKWCGVEKADLDIVRDYYKKQKERE